MTQEVGLKDGWDAAIAAMQNSGGGPFGAAIMRGDKIVSTGCNLVLPRRDATAHAVIIAIRRACAGLNTSRLTDCELYTTCEPCPMCLAAAYWARLRRVYYAVDRHAAELIGFGGSFIYNELAAPNFDRRLRMRQCSGLRALRVEKIMRDWHGEMY
jgi:guanine deaminase